MAVTTRTNVARIRFWSVVAISAAAYLQAILACYGETDPGRDVLTLVLGVVYSVFCIVGHRVCEQPPQHVWCIAYFAVQIPLAALVLGLSPHAGPAAYFLLPLVSHAAFAFSVRVALAVCGVLLALGMGNLAWREGGYALLLYAPAYLGGFIFTGGLSHLLTREVASRSRAEALATELERANAQILAHASHAEALAIERERNRLAREIHDGLGHYLTSIAIQSEAAKALVGIDDRVRAASCMEKTGMLAREAMQDVRNSVGLLRSECERVPLLEQIGRLASADPGLAVSVGALGSVRGLALPVEHALFRTVQEGLTNVRKHAGSARAEVTLDFRDPAKVSIEVCNESTDLPEESAPRGFGLNGIRERIEALGGRMVAGIRDSGGFCLKVEVPG